MKEQSCGKWSVEVVVFSCREHALMGIITHPQYPMDERAPIPLAIHHTPLCVTFAYIEE